MTSKRLILYSFVLFGRYSQVLFVIGPFSLNIPAYLNYGHMQEVLKIELIPSNVTLLNRTQTEVIVLCRPFGLTSEL